MTRLETIAARIDSLARHPGAVQVFGAEARHYGHSFRRRTVTLDELSELETRLGVNLPPEYQSLVTLVGCNVGPYYGMLGPSGLLEEFADVGTLTDENGDPAREFLITRTALEQHLREGTAHIPTSGAWHGCVPVCFQGCQFWSMLVTTGEFMGTVWDVASYGDCDDQWIPACRPPGIVSGTIKIKHLELSALPKPPTLLQWYEGWLERVESDLALLRPDPLIRRLLNKFSRPSRPM
jgi:hypothetical protein